MFPARHMVRAVRLAVLSLLLWLGLVPASAQIYSTAQRGTQYKGTYEEAYGSMNDGYYGSMEAQYEYNPYQSNVYKPGSSTPNIGLRKRYTIPSYTPWSDSYAPMRTNKKNAPTGTTGGAIGEDNKSENDPEGETGAPDGFITPSDPGHQSNQSPVGEAWILLFFAAAAALVVFIRQKREKRHITIYSEVQQPSDKSNMKQHIRKSLFISIILLAGVSNAWAWNEYNKQYLYFDGSSFTAFFSDGCTPYISPKWDYNCNDGNSNGGDKQMTSITSEKYYYLDLSKSSSSYKSFRGFYIGRSASFYNGASMGVVDGSTSNCIKATGWGTYEWTNFAPPMSSASIENKSTVYGGNGTSNNPYQIEKGATISIQASATSSVPNDPQTKYYQFYKKENSGTRSAIGNESTTTTSSFTASSTVGTKYEVDVEARNEYYSTYGEKATSSKLYFVTIEPIYAILGSFNNWTHSANTWDLSDQGSNNWKATFYLGKGSHTFKVVHNSTYYGKNSTTITRSSATASSLSTSGADINLTADYAGNYTFTFNSSTKNLTVTYPTIYTVTYSRVPTAAANAPTTDPSISSGDYVLANTSVTFNAKAANTGYTWKGWYSNNSGTGEALSTNLAYTRSITANTTIYAVYTANTYTVKFDANGGSGTMSDQNFTYGTSQNLTANNFTRTGYTFAGWATSANGNKVYDDIQSVSNLSTTNGATVTLYAKWTPINYTITYHTNGGIGTMTPTSYTIETETFDLPTPAKTGYTFNGWYTQSNFSDSPVTQITKGSTGDKTFYAKWTEKAANTVYLKAATWWKNNDARTAIWAWEENSNPAVEGWVDVDYDDCIGNILRAEIPAKYDRIKFVRLKPSSADGYNGENNGYHWDNEWNSTETLTVPTDNKNLYDMTTLANEHLFFQSNSNWTIDGARTAAYFFGNGEKWVSMTDIGNGCYYCEKPSGYTKVIFVRMDGSKPENNWDNDWNQTGNLTLPTDGKNLYTINGALNNLSGTWSTGADNVFDNHRWTTYTAPRFDITINPCENGTIKVVYGGTIYTSGAEDVIIEDVLIHSELTITFTPAEGYELTTPLVTYADVVADNIYSICGPATISAEFVARGNTKVIYLRPNDAWLKDDAIFIAHAWKNGSSDQHDYLMTTKDDDYTGSYSCTIDSKYDHVLFARINPEHKTNQDRNEDWLWNEVCGGYYY